MKSLLATAGITGLLFAGLGACSSTPLPEIPIGHFDPLHEIPAVEIPAALQVDTAERPDTDIAVGDCAVYSLSIDEPAGRRSWLVRTAISQHAPRPEGTATITNPDHPPLTFALKGFVRFHVQVTEPDGTLLSEAYTDRVPADVLRAGFLRMCEFYAAHSELETREVNELLRALPEAERRPILISGLAPTSMLELVLKAEPLAPLLEAAIRKPSLLTVALNLAQGIQVSFHTDKARVWPGPTAFPGSRAYVYPLDVVAFSEPALQATMVVTDGAAKLPVTVGVSSLAATHPEHPEICVRLRLQAVGRLADRERVRIMAGLGPR